MFEPVTACRCCGGSDLLPYLDLGNQPLANSYHGGGTELPRFPLEVAFCRDCAHSQLSVVVAPEVLFRNYLYVSGTTETYRAHCRELARETRARVTAKVPRVLDIACNDGTLLECFRDLGCQVEGVDPALNLREITKAKGLHVRTEFWGPAAAAAAGAPFDVVTGANVLGHVAEPFGFLTSCREVLGPKGVLVLEFPYGVETVERCEFDQVYHEHVSYFLVRSFSLLAERTGFTIKGVVRTPIHGGSIRFILRRGRKPHCESVRRLLDEESERGLYLVDTYLGFAARAATNRTELVTQLRAARALGRGVVGYGASAKGNTMLNHFEIDLDYIVDDNRLKWSLLTPGRNVPIREPAALATDDRPLSIVVLSWNFLDEIKKKIRAIRGSDRGDTCVLYVPRVREESLEPFLRRALRDPTPHGLLPLLQ